MFPSLHIVAELKPQLQTSEPAAYSALVVILAARETINSTRTQLVAGASEVANNMNSVRGGNISHVHYME